MDTTDTPKAVDTTDTIDTDAAPKPPEDTTILPAIQETNGETHEAVADTVQEKFDTEKFWKEFEEQLCEIDKEGNFNTVEESLIPKLQKSLIPALEAGVDSRDLRSFTLKFFKFNKLARNQVLTAISTAAITACLKNAQKEGLVRDPSVYADFTVSLLDIERCRLTANSRAGASDTSQRLHDELKRVINAKDMNTNPLIFIKIAQIVFPDYASVIPIAVIHYLLKMAEHPAN